MVDVRPDLSDLGWTDLFAARFTALDAGTLDPDRLRNLDRMQRELRFLARRQHWAKMKKHQPRPSDSGDDD
jgi:hypothetical protein